MSNWNEREDESMYISNRINDLKSLIRNKASSKEKRIEARKSLAGCYAALDWNNHINHGSGI